MRSSTPEVCVASARDRSADQQRLVTLCTAYHGRITAYVLRRVPDREDAADVVADVFAVAWRRIEDAPPGERALPWLFGVARRVVANHHRGQRRRRHLATKLEATAPTPAQHHHHHHHHHHPEAVVEQVDMAPIAAAFRSLREPDREVLRLVGWEALSRHDVAIALGCSRPTARLRLHRARRRFLAALEERDVDVSRWLPPPRAPERTDGVAQTTEGPT